MNCLGYLAIASTFVVGLLSVGLNLVDVQAAVGTNLDAQGVAEVTSPEAEDPRPETPLPSKCYIEGFVAVPGNPDPSEVIDYIFLALSMGQYDQILTWIQTLPNEQGKLRVLEITIRHLDDNSKIQSRESRIIYESDEVIIFGPRVRSKQWPDSSKPQSEQMAKFWAQMIQSAETFRQPENRALALLAIAEEMVGLGRKQDVPPLIAKATLAIQALKNQEQTINLQVKLAQLYANLGEFDQAIQTLKPLNSQKQKNEALLKLVETAARADRFEQALAIANSLSTPETQALALNHLARAYIRVGKFTEASNRLAQVLQLAQQVNTAFTKSDLMAEAAVSYAKAGQDQTALQLVQRIDPEHRATHARDLAEYYLEQQQNERVLQVVQIMRIGGDTEPLSEILSKLAKNYIQAGKYEAVLHLAHSLPPLEANPNWDRFFPGGDGRGNKLGILTSLAVHYNKIGEQQKALDLFQSILPEAEKTARLTELAEIVILYYQVTGDQQRSLQLLNTVRQRVQKQGDFRPQIFDLNAVVIAYVLVDQHDQAMQTIQDFQNVLKAQRSNFIGSQGIPDRWISDHTLRDIADVLMSKAQLQPALQFVNLIQRVNYKNDLLYNMAMQMAAAKQYEQALTFAAKMTDAVQRDRLTRMLECAKAQSPPAKPTSQTRFNRFHLAQGVGGTEVGHNKVGVINMDIKRHRRHHHPGNAAALAHTPTTPTNGLDKPLVVPGQMSNGAILSMTIINP